MNDSVAAPFWQALADEAVVLPYCHSCGRCFFYPRAFCPHCWSAETGWTRSTGHGVLYARSLVTVPFQGIDPAGLPYLVGLAELDEGVRLVGRLPADDPPQPGDRVVAAFGGPGRPLFFRRCAGTAGGP